jgi:hypothetical protein
VCHFRPRHQRRAATLLPPPVVSEDKLAAAAGGLRRAALVVGVGGQAEQDARAMADVLVHGCGFPSDIDVLLGPAVRCREEARPSR